MVSKKVLLVGNFGVGKTSLIRRFVLNEFSEDYISTIGVRVSKKIVEFENQQVKLIIWDVAGTTGNEKVPKAYFLGASSAMLVFDVSRVETYLHLEDYVQTIKELSKLKEVTIVGNKKDLLTTDELEKVIDKINVKVDLVTSAKEDDNVEEAFVMLAKESIK
ncbi:Rab family GTPase [Flavicella sediminum]|uniref:Rab family GTPase n=1 Tax=Flavicella sediminum TaxID=2585141 RepID=UPI001122BB0C|nr:Rab family GTPase [Flavicella sediminum]